MGPDDAFALPSERRVFVALREAHARDEQREAILAAYDEVEPKLEELGERLEILFNRWHGLDRQDPAFRERAASLAAEYAEIARTRMDATAGFEARVADTLDAEQWEAWDEFWTRPAFGPGMEGPGGGPMRGGRRR